jgi:hypothetical protein
MIARDLNDANGGKAAGRGSDLSGAEAHGPAASFDHLVGAVGNGISSTETSGYSSRPET